MASSPKDELQAGAGRSPARQVVLLAFGGFNYREAAINMAASIRHVSKEQIHLLTTFDIQPAYADLFDRIERIPEHRVFTNGDLDPGKVKANLYALLPKGDSLYLDVDGLCLKDPGPLFDKLQQDGRPLIMEVISKGQQPAEYFEWATPRSINEKFGLDDETLHYAVQSSWMFIRKGSAKKLLDCVSIAHDRWALGELTDRWGISIPDELAFSCACAIKKYDPSWERNVIHFGSKYAHDSFTELRDSNYFLSLYGQGTGRMNIRSTYLDMYDRYLVDVFAKRGQSHQYKHHRIMRGKYVNTTPRR